MSPLIGSLIDLSKFLKYNFNILYIFYHTYYLLNLKILYYLLILTLYFL